VIRSGRMFIKHAAVPTYNLHIFYVEIDEHTGETGNSDISFASVSIYIL
jgi:hypothetical protein